MLIEDVFKINWKARIGSGLIDRWTNVQACLESEEENSLEINTFSFYDNNQGEIFDQKTDHKDFEVTLKLLKKVVSSARQNTDSAQKTIDQIKSLKKINLESFEQIKQALILLWKNLNSDLGIYLDEVIDQKLTEQNLTKKEILEIKSFYLSIKFQLDYQRQEIDLRKLAQIYKQKFGDQILDYSKLSRDFKDLLTQHLDKYQSSFKQNLTEGLIDILDIYNMLKQELENPRKIEEENIPRSLNKITKQNQEFLKLVNQHIYLDNYSGDLYTKIEFFLTKLISEKFNINSLDLAWYSFDDLERLIGQKNKLTKQQIEERKSYRVMVKIDSEIGFFYGENNLERIKKILQFPKTINSKTTLIKGTSACLGITRGIVKIINNTRDMKKLKNGEVLVSVMTRPELMMALKKASAIVTDTGGITSHAAILSRELNIPCIVGTKIATQVLKDGDLVEVDADQGVVRIINN